MDNNSDSKSKGGKARAASLSPEERSNIAKNAANSKWDKSMTTVLLGAKLTLGGVEVDCYVTEDGERLIAGRGMQEILKLVDEDLPKSGQKPGSRLTRLLSNNTLKPLIYKHKNQDHFFPKKRRYQGRIIAGFNAEMLVDICEGMLEARILGVLKTTRQSIIAAQCELIMRGLAKTGIVALIDEATGYQNLRPADGLRNYFDQVLKKDLAAWFKRFPDEYYENIYKLKGWEWPGMAKNRFSVVGTYTNDLVWERLIPGLKEELNHRNPKNEKGHRARKHHEWLNNEAGDKLFSQQMFTILALQRACLNKPGNKWIHFMSMMDDILPKKGTTINLFPYYDLPSEN
ncbi:P63C domain-containing protein [Nitrosomonas ureae]|uniref:p63C domain-containing protein n=1 Tax=Nitrosomonas ureae TaxID=44577 RepID=A0A1H5T810_9PROT|nr:P63C domain-containing protein [Nitrosomonas ureae]SEF58936.1 P63C domain-containing protein [Nitrosomonas ureae]